MIAHARARRNVRGKLSTEDYRRKLRRNFPDVTVSVESYVGVFRSVNR